MLLLRVAEITRPFPCGPCRRADVSISQACAIPFLGSAWRSWQNRLRPPALVVRGRLLFPARAGSQCAAVCWRHVTVPRGPGQGHHVVIYYVGVATLGVVTGRTGSVFSKKQTAARLFLPPRVHLVAIPEWLAGDNHGPDGIADPPKAGPTMPPDHREYPSEAVTSADR